MLGGLAEHADQSARVEAGAHREHAEEPPRTLQGIAAAGIAARGQLRGHHAVLRGAPHVQRLRHRAEVQADAGAHARSDRERVGERVGIQTEQLRRADRRPEGAEGAGGVEAVLVVARVNRFRHLAFHLEADEIGFEELPARYAKSFAECQACRERRDRRMREQAKDAIGR